MTQLMEKTMTAEKGALTQERQDNLFRHSRAIVATLAVKNPKYGDSWKSHGGFSAFFNTQRKWSRVENLASKHGYDIFAAIDATRAEPDGMLETLKDLVGYALLILDEREKLPFVPAPERVRDNFTGSAQGSAAPGLDRPI